MQVQKFCHVRGQGYSAGCKQAKYQPGKLETPQNNDRYTLKNGFVFDVLMVLCLIKERERERAWKEDGGNKKENRKGKGKKKYEKRGKKDEGGKENERKYRKKEGETNGKIQRGNYKEDGRLNKKKKK